MTRLKKLKEELNSANKEEEVKVEKTEKPKKEKKAKAVVKWSNLFKDSLILIHNATWRRWYKSDLKFATWGQL